MLASAAAENVFGVRRKLSPEVPYSSEAIHLIDYCHLIEFFRQISTPQSLVV